ncbi:DUF2913 family protein [Klebsiella sp. PL-2018]|uniref:DUF2913 family protein n=1 Tax=Klebsiella sp. PL-2018 TaxID=2851540 RepID=UPI001C224F7E|nr:DUF2913 family protein [Klebsiella sp. PL-2018]QXD00954.1 hypothetical protein MKleb_5453 [Klebsiella sp. PL-2018]
MSQLNKAGDLAWCGLIALALAKRDGIVQSASQENLFLTRWLATALKQRRFPRSVTPDIEWLLGQGRTLGMKARLPEKLDYLWRSCHGDIAEQNDLFRLTYAFELAKDAGWVYNLLTDREWTGRYAVKLNAGINGIFALRSSIDNGFDANGRVRYPLAVRITGNIEAVTELFATCGWTVTPDDEGNVQHAYKLVIPKATL